ncbi:MAG TPA: Gfo/Idh/MocA family oxidoreductase [Candidatus Binatia bacterium]
MRELGVAVIGLGVGEQHARAYADLEHCVIRWLYDIDEVRMHRLVKELGQGAAAGTLETVWDDPSVRVVSIASYDDAHYEQVVRGLRSGKHVFVEKPMCRSVEELREIRDAWKESDHRHLASNLVLRAAPVYKWLRDAVDSGDLGEIYAFDGDYLYGRLSKITEGWRGSVESYSVMQGGGIHLLDLMLWVTGQKPVSVTASGNRICTSGSDFHYDDFVAATFGFQSGLIGRVSANFGCVHRHQHVVRLFGTKGTFIYDDRGPRLYSSRDPSSAAASLDLDALPDSKGALIPGFVAGILDGVPGAAETQHELDLIAACLSVDRSLQTRGPVEIQYL